MTLKLLPKLVAITALPFLDASENSSEFTVRPGVRVS